MTAEDTPPGWYHAESDPPETERYWDGSKWEGEPRPAAPPPAGPSEKSKATTILVLGVLALIPYFFFVAPLAWMMGNTELRAIDAGRRPPGKRGIANAGRILGIILTAVYVLSVLALIAVRMLGDGDEAARTYNDGVEMFDEGRIGDAVDAFTDTIELEPGDVELLARAHVTRSLALTQLGRFEEAIVDAAAAIELEPGDVDLLAGAHLNRSASYGQLGRFEEAMADATAVIDLEPSDPVRANGHYFRALGLNELGRPDEAVPDLRAILRLLPPDDPMNLHAAAMLAGLGLSE